MSQLDLDIKNYDYNELLNLFKIEKNDNRSNILYKLDNQRGHGGGGNIITFFESRLLSIQY